VGAETVTNLDESAHPDKINGRRCQCQINSVFKKTRPISDSVQVVTFSRWYSVGVGGYCRGTYVLGGVEDGFPRFATSRRDGGRGGYPRLRRSPLVSRASTVGKTEAKTTKRVRTRTESLCMAGRIWGKEEVPWKRPSGAAWHRLISEFSRTIRAFAPLHLLPLSALILDSFE
jgi:hypothetical protein